MGETGSSDAIATAHAAGRTTLSVRPEPAADEVVAIVATMQLLAAGPAARPPASEPPSWRFSGRWWTQPTPLRRPRPWT